MQRLPSNVQTCYNSYVFLTVVVLYVLLGVHGNPGAHGSKRVGKRYTEAYRSGHNENDSKCSSTKEVISPKNLDFTGFLW